MPCLGRREFAKMLALVSTCGKCQAPIRKAFSKIAYERGVVLVTCGGCGVRHLVADHLGWMADHSTRAGLVFV